jgi:hypothetical protein
MCHLVSYITIILNLMTASTGGAAAWYWWLSSKVAYPHELRGFAPIGGSVTVNTNPLLVAAQECGRLNRIAACWSAITAGLVALSALAEAFCAP